MKNLAANDSAAYWLAAVAIMAVVMFVSGLVVLIVEFAVGGRSATVTVAGSSLAMAGATTGLVVGSAAAAWYFHQQVAETRRASHNALRPVVIIDRAWSEWFMVWVRVRNVGPGPALSVYISGWDRYGEAPSAFEGRFAEYGAFVDGERDKIRDVAGADIGAGLGVLGAGDTVDISLLDETDPSRTQDERQHKDPEGRLYYRIRFEDVFGTRFGDPPEDEPLRMTVLSRVPDDRSRA